MEYQHNRIFPLVTLPGAASQVLDINFSLVSRFPSTFYHSLGRPQPDIGVKANDVESITDHLFVLVVEVEADFNGRKTSGIKASHNCCPDELLCHKGRELVSVSKYSRHISKSIYYALRTYLQSIRSFVRNSCGTHSLEP
jgi:hypothetical protein